MTDSIKFRQKFHKETIILTELVRLSKFSLSSSNLANSRASNAEYTVQKAVNKVINKLIYLDENSMAINDTRIST